MAIKDLLSKLFIGNIPPTKTLQEGETAPDFTLNNEQGQTLSLTQLRGKKVILYFYPKDFTPVCTKQACLFKNKYVLLKNMNVEVLGISRDSEKRHRLFKQSCELPFQLLSDSNGQVCQSYNALSDNWLLKHTLLGIRRMTYLIDEDGKIITVWRKVNIDNHIDEILSLLQSRRCSTWSNIP